MGYTDAPDGWRKEFVAELPARTGKLAVVRAGGTPHVVPVWVDLDTDDPVPPETLVRVHVDRVVAKVDVAA